MKKLLSIVLAAVIVSTSILPIVAFAFSGTFTRTQSIVVTDTTGTARTNVPVSLTGINANTYKTSAYINTSGTNTAMTDNSTGADEQFMMQEGTSSGLIIPTLLPYSSVSVNLLMGTSVNQTGFPIIAGSGGYVTTTTAANLEPLSNNFSLGVTVDIGHSSNITRRNNSLLLTDNGTGTVTGNLTGTLSVNQTDASGGTFVGVGLGGTTRGGQYFPSFAAGTISSVSLYLLSDFTTGVVDTANVTVRRASDDALLGYLGSILVDNIPDQNIGQPAAYSTFSNPVVNPTKQDIRIQIESSNTTYFIYMYQSTGSVGHGNAARYTAGTYVNATGDATMNYAAITNAVVTATGISAGLRNVVLANTSNNLTLTIDGALQDSVFGASVNNSASNWLWLEGVPYADNITYSVNGTQQLYYAPAVMISGAVLPDRSADATNNDGTITWGANSGLTVTYGSVLDAPSIQTLDASGILSTSAYLAGKLLSLGSNPDVTVGFQWGLDTNYGSGSTPIVQETAATTYFFQLTGLTPSTTYHYRAFVTAGTQTLYGTDKSFATQPVAGSSTTILIRSARVFQNYITTGDFLIVSEVVNNYTNLYPSQTPREHFTVQLLALDNLTVLAASPLTNWGDRPASIYLNPTAGAILTVGAHYFIKMIGDSTANFTSVEYTLQTTDWKGADLSALDSWNIGTAINMAISDGVSVGTYIAYPTNQSAVINDSAGGFFTTGIPNIGQIRPHSFTTAQYQTPITAGTASNVWDKTDADPTGWRAFVGTSFSTDVDKFALPFGITGKDFAAAGVLLLMLGCVMVVTGSGGALALGGVFISVPILWLGTFARIMPIAVIILMIIFFSAFAIRQFVIKTL